MPVPNSSMERCRVPHLEKVGTQGRTSASAQYIADEDGWRRRQEGIIQLAWVRILNKLLNKKSFELDSNNRRSQTVNHVRDTYSRSETTVTEVADEVRTMANGKGVESDQLSAELMKLPYARTPPFSWSSTASLLRSAGERRCCSSGTMPPSGSSTSTTAQSEVTTGEIPSGHTRKIIFKIVTPTPEGLLRGRSYFSNNSVTFVPSDRLSTSCLSFMIFYGPGVSDMIYQVSPKLI